MPSRALVDHRPANAGAAVERHRIRYAGQHGHLAEARRELTEVGKQRPAWAQVPLRLAEVNDLEGKRREAAENYVRAIAMGERRMEVVRRAVQLLYERRGFDQADPSLSKSLGLLGMRERAAILGGHVDISSAPGKGTTVTAWIPLLSPEGSGAMP